MGNAKPSFRKRLHAWWEGYDLPETPPGTREAGETDSSGGSAQPAAAESSVEDGANAEEAAVGAVEVIAPEGWSKARMMLSQMVFGTGFIEPGGEQAALSGVGSLALDGTTNFLDIGAGLGGGARAIASSLGAYVAAMDLDADLIAMGQSQVRDANLLKKVDIGMLDFRHSGFRTNRNAGAILRNVLSHSEDKLALLDASAASIRPGGLLIIEDRFLSYQRDTAPFEQWHSGEGIEIFPVDIDTLERNLAELGLTVRVTEDITAAYIASLVEAWGTFATIVENQGISPELSDSVMVEAERWSRRLTVLKSDDLCIQRIIAQKP